MDKYNFDFNEVGVTTENGAKSYSTTGSVIVDQFGKAGNYRNRELDDVFSDQKALWDSNALIALRFPFYLRMITRKIKVNESNITQKVQKGQGVRDESFKRLLWIAKNEEDAFYKHIWALPLVGSWKDLWTIMFYDIKFEVNCIKHEILFELINEGLKSTSHSELIKKYMPRIKSNGKCTTDWSQITNILAKKYANFNGMTYREYNKLKTSGTAHDFQKLICSGRYSDINWGNIPGRALSTLINGNFLEAHGLTKKYIKWLISQPTVKFTGYPYELARKVINSLSGYVGDSVNKTRKLNMPIYEQVTINKQFDELVRKASEGGTPLGNVWCALDTSGSMTSSVSKNTDVSAIDVCISLGVFLSSLNKGAFHKNVIMFDDESRVKQLDGDFCEMIRSIFSEDVAWGSTNFMSVIEEIVRVRKKNPNIPLEEFPDSIVVISDMQFNIPCNENYTTNFEKMKEKLYEVFPKEFVDNMKFIWWQVTSRTNDYPAEIGPGETFISGFDGSILSLILGGEVKEIEKKKGRPLTSEETIKIALSQEILQLINI